MHNKTIADVIAYTSRSWIAAHSLLNNPKALEAACDMARKEPNPDRLLARVMPSEPASYS